MHVKVFKLDKRQVVISLANKADFKNLVIRQIAKLSRNKDLTYKDKEQQNSLPYYGPYIGSSATTQKGHRRVNRSGIRGARTSRTIGQGVAKLYNQLRYRFGI